jgi:hypothetical protein
MNHNKLGHAVVRLNHIARTIQKMTADMKEPEEIYLLTTEALDQIMTIRAVAMQEIEALHD